jgi:hypothetical protein
MPLPRPFVNASQRQKTSDKKSRRRPVSGERRHQFAPRRFVSRILFPLSRKRPFLWDARRRAPQAAYPRILTLRAGTLRLFGLAAGGVCRAIRVTPDAVRSYRTISPLPDPPFGMARRYLSVALSVGLIPVSRDCSALTLSSTVALRSSDFPHPGLSRNAVATIAAA